LILKKYLVINKKIKNFYEEEWSLECGLSLKGKETKIIRGKDITIGYGIIKNNELFLKNYLDRDIKLLAHKNQIIKLKKFKILVIKEIYKLKYWKILLCAGKKLKNYEKKDKLKKLDLERYSL